MLDTNVALALFAFADPTCKSLAVAVRERRLQAVASVATRDEWLCVLWRDALPFEPATRLAAAAAFDTQVLDAYTAGTDRSAALPHCRDPDDQIFLELARDAGCAVLFSRDRELLKLSRRCMRVAGFSVCLPEEYRR